MPPSAAHAPYGNPAHAPPVHPQAHTQSSSGQPGLLAQMAATAGSVAVGSTVGHGISSMLFGGSSARAEEQPSPQQLNQQANAAPYANQQQAAGISCEGQAKEFTKCLEKADLPSCTWYLEQLKACQAAAAPY
ncbi:hypothetical protein NEOLEDRAFT_1179923 [Neolentinus lepideus HHB14362 ss-1]|uniref:CHCH domain-containing protein n=1 Tax=Neolentinus lepideus HHB14362 ss-1 TaxID=1314782 RepID=A0A165REN1_9AGAM|nr:hypothetical protein NEOLEDRAFT_1179923 [Neolentinus lepideus HHB14362 ss-1]